jgi:hypothetical protein
MKTTNPTTTVQAQPENALQKFIDKQAKELLKFQSEQRLRSELPVELRDKGMVCIHNDHASFSLHEYGPFANRKLSEALKLVREFAPKLVESEHWKDGCVSVRPAKINSSATKESATMDGAHAVEIKVEGGKGYGPNVDVKFWIQLDWGLVEMSVRVSDLWKLVPHVHNNYDQGEIVSSQITWPDESRCVDSFRKWWSSPGSYAGSYYLADLPNFESWASHMIAPALQPKA